MGETSEKKRLLLILNPCAGTRRANRLLADIATVFMQHGYESLLCVTEQRGDATQFVLRHAHEVELVVAVGGDGTFNEAVAGLLTCGRELPLGYIPAGSTNDFASSLKLSKNIVKAAEDIVIGTPRTLDVGQFGDRLFSYVASFGAFTKASYTTSQNLKNSLGHMAYVLEGLRDLAGLRSHHLKFTTESGVFEGDYIFGAVSNSTSVGGILTLDPKMVDMNDGRLELLLIKSPKTLIELNECILALTTQDYTSSMITFCSTPWVSVECSPDMDWTLDGEFEPGCERVEIRNLPSALTLMVNPRPSKKKEEPASLT